MSAKFLLEQAGAVIASLQGHVCRVSFLLNRSQVLRCSDNTQETHTDLVEYKACFLSGVHAENKLNPFHRYSACHVTDTSFLRAKFKLAQNIYSAEPNKVAQTFTLVI